MTDDMQTLRAALQPDDPSQDVVDRSRHRLRNRIGGLTTRKRNRWLAVGSGVTVTAAAAAVAIAMVPSAPTDSPLAPPPSRGTTGTSAPARPMTAQQVLLAAATAAADHPDSSGTYWYVKEITEEDTDRPADVYETWTTQNGAQWWRGFKSSGQLVANPFRIRNPFSLPAATMTLEQLRALPADATRLKAAIIQAIRRDDVRTSAGPIKDDPKMLASFTFDSFISLVSTLPAPPAVRATAFRAIAGYPGVKNLGQVPGGNGLRLPDGERLVVDPETGRVNGTSVIVTMDGAEHYPGVEGGTIRIDARWTDTLPS
jgi:hypothetical protein